MKIFLSYSSRDRDLRAYLERELAVHLNALAPNTYTLWSDTGIDIGANWREVIDTQMAESAAALLLVSPGFMASEFIGTVELTEFFRRKHADGYLLLPVEIRHTPYWGELAQLNFFKTYRTDYGFTRPADRNERLAFEQLYDNDRTTDTQLNTYFTKLATYIHTAVKRRATSSPKPPKTMDLSEIALSGLLSTFTGPLAADLLKGIASNAAYDTLKKVGGKVLDLFKGKKEAEKEIKLLKLAASEANTEDFREQTDSVLTLLKTTLETDPAFRQELEQLLKGAGEAEEKAVRQQAGIVIENSKNVVAGNTFGDITGGFRVGDNYGTEKP